MEKVMDTYSVTWEQIDQSNLTHKQKFLLALLLGACDAQNNNNKLAEAKKQWADERDDLREQLNELKRTYNQLFHAYQKMESQLVEKDNQKKVLNKKLRAQLNCCINALQWIAMNGLRGVIGAGPQCADKAKETLTQIEKDKMMPEPNPRDRLDRMSKPYSEDGTNITAIHCAALAKEVMLYAEKNCGKAEARGAEMVKKVIEKKFRLV